MRNIFLIAAAAGALVACAQQQGRPGEAKADRPYCLQDTGSRIPTKPGECNDQYGRSISHDDMERTGAINTTDAIRRIDPSVR